MRNIGAFLLAAVLALPASGAAEAPNDAAMEVLEEFMVAFNSRDEQAMVDTMHFPHVRIASGTVSVSETAEAMMAAFDFDVFAERFGWDHSDWAAREIVQTSADKVHVATTFVRYDADDNEIARFESMYIVEKVEGTWGIRARSSFAP